MNPVDRYARINELEMQLYEIRNELSELRFQDSKTSDAEHDAFIDECRRLKAEHKVYEAVKLYRNKIGTGLCEAYDYITAL